MRARSAAAAARTSAHFEHMLVHLCIDPADLFRFRDSYEDGVAWVARVVRVEVRNAAVRHEEHQEDVDDENERQRRAVGIFSQRRRIRRSWRSLWHRRVRRRLAVVH